MLPCERFITLASAPLCYESGSIVFVLLAVIFLILMSYLPGAQTCARLSAGFLCLPFQPPCSIYAFCCLRSLVDDDQNSFKCFSSVSKTFSIKSLHLYT